MSLTLSTRVIQLKSMHKVKDMLKCFAGLGSKLLFQFPLCTCGRWVNDSLGEASLGSSPSAPPLPLPPRLLEPRAPPRWLLAPQPQGARGLPALEHRAGSLVPAPLCSVLSTRKHCFSTTNRVQNITLSYLVMFYMRLVLSFGTDVAYGL